jgi:hypothetical protein
MGAVLRKCFWALASCARIGLGSIFVFTGISKLQEPYEFLSAVYSYELVGPRTGWAIAAAVPCLELAVGVSLILRVLERGAWSLALALLAVFAVAKLSVLQRGILVPCGCRSPSGEEVGMASVLATALMLAGAVVGLAYSTGFAKPERNSQGAA